MFGPQSKVTGDVDSAWEILEAAEQRH
jgi:hypothetical protein